MAATQVASLAGRSGAVTSRRSARTGRPQAAARAIRDLQHQDLRDLVWCDLDPGDAPRRTPRCGAASLRRTPEAAVGAGGRGARVRVLARRRTARWPGARWSVPRAQDPDNVLADLVAQALDGGTAAVDVDPDGPAARSRSAPGERLSGV